MHRSEHKSEIGHGLVMGAGAMQTEGEDGNSTGVRVGAHESGASTRGYEQQTGASESRCAQTRTASKREQENTNEQT
jgi:hypothetical protein